MSRLRQRLFSVISSSTAFLQYFCCRPAQLQSARLMNDQCVANGKTRCPTNSPRPIFFVLQASRLRQDIAKWGRPLENGPAVTPSNHGLHCLITSQNAQSVRACQAAKRRATRRTCSSLRFSRVAAVATPRQPHLPAQQLTTSTMYPWRLTPSILRNGNTDERERARPSVRRGHWFCSREVGWRRCRTGHSMRPLLQPASTSAWNFAAL